VDGAPRYDYRLRSGAYADRVAMALLEHEGLLETLRKLPADRDSTRESIARPHSS